MSTSTRALGPDPGVADLLQLVDRVIDFTGAGINRTTAQEKKGSFKDELRVNAPMRFR